MEKLLQKMYFKNLYHFERFHLQQRPSQCLLPAILSFPRIHSTFFALLCTDDFGIRGQLSLLGIEMCLPSNP